MTPLEWLALCVFEEAQGEPADGKAAVARVVLNRAARRYSSDGTIKGTVTWPTQFSWCEFDWSGGRYVRVCRGPAEIETRAADLLVKAKAHAAVWADCLRVAQAVQVGSYVGGAAYRALTPDTVLYDNLTLASPAWALAADRVTTIGRHVFFRAAPQKTGLAG